VATFWSATCASYGDGVAFVVVVAKHMDSSILVINAIPSL
jgi:hypothetical protein